MQFISLSLKRSQKGLIIGQVAVTVVARSIQPLDFIRALLDFF